MVVRPFQRVGHATQSDVTSVTDKCRPHFYPCSTERDVLLWRLNIMSYLELVSRPLPSS